MRLLGFLTAYLFQCGCLLSAEPKHLIGESKSLPLIEDFFIPKQKSVNRKKKIVKTGYVLTLILVFGLALTVISNLVMSLMLHDHFLNLRNSTKQLKFYRKIPTNYQRIYKVSKNHRDHKAINELESVQNATSIQSKFDIQDLDFNNIVHVVQTRFMQNQPDLIHLARARLELFRTICLPTMRNQSTQNFVWIIFTDPSLNESIKEEMIKLLSPYPNYVLVGDNHFPENFRGAHHLAKINAKSFFSGNIDILRESHRQAQNKLVLETRLDADDGLQFLYLEKIQHHVMETFPKNKTADWMLWCLNASVEWSMKNPFPKHIKTDRSSGYFLLASDGHCITPGLSIAYGSNISFTQLPKLRHDTLHKKVPKCMHKMDANCLNQLPPKLLAFRARTPTSAGMQRVIVDDNVGFLNEKAGGQSKRQEEILHYVEEVFAFDTKIATPTRKSILRNIEAIAADNLKGQCTPGHSCKDAAKKILQKLASRGSPEK